MNIYKIKPLVWQDVSVGGYKLYQAFTSSPIAVYTIEGLMDMKTKVYTYYCYANKRDGVVSVGKESTPEKAKELCQEHWRLYLEKVLIKVQ